jgi:hypothetical protein
MKLRAFLTMMLLLVGVGVASASPAMASTGTVTVTVTTTQCPLGGTVKAIWYSIDQGGVVNAAPGDTASTSSLLGVRVYISGKALCDRGWLRTYYSEFHQIPRYFWTNGYHTYI